MNTHIRYLIAIAILLFFVFYFLNRMETLKREGKQKDSIISEKTDSIRYHRNESGKLVAEKSAALASIKEVKDAYPELEEELRRDFDVKFKNLKAYIRNEFEARGSGTATVTNNYYDSSTHLTARKLEFNDGYLRYKAVIDSTSSAVSEYTYTDTITTIVHGKKKWFLGNEKFYASTELANPNAKATKTTNILIEGHRDKRWVITAGAYWSPVAPKSFGVGITVGYALIKF